MDKNKEYRAFEVIIPVRIIDSESKTEDKHEIPIIIGATSRIQAMERFANIIELIDNKFDFIEDLYMEGI